jgi:dienelactone hydrolase
MTTPPTPPTATTPAQETPLPTGTPGGGQQGTPVTTERVEQARRLITQMAEGEFEAAEESFDDTMKQQLPADRLREVWGQITTQAGAYRDQGDATTSSEGGYDVVIVRCRFENLELDTRVVFDAEGRVAGLFFAPAASGTPAPTYSPPAYVDSGAFTEREVRVGSGEWVLTGTLTLPNGEGPFPAVVLVHGSGPHDRDETIGPNKVFRDLAWGLASNGVAVLRYDKRTLVYGVKMGQMRDITVKEETVDDAAAAVSLLRETEGIDRDRVFVLGHSLGGMLAPRIAQAAPDLAGLVIMAGAARRLEDAVLDQYTYLANLDGTVTADEQKRLDETREQVARVKDPSLSPDAPPDTLPLGIPAPYWLDLRGYEPARAAAGLPQPVLILQGERDYQVTMADFDLWRAALAGRDDVEMKSYGSLNHLFITGDGPSSPDEYNEVGHVDAQVVRDIAGWIKGIR